MANHTKGPWKAKRLSTYQDPGWVVLWPDNGGAHMRRLDSSGNFTGPDAALIAAAPELLEALEDALGALVCCGKDYEWVTSKARAAIEKATGQ